MHEADEVLFEIRGHVALITLNRPSKLNAWTTPMREHIIEALTRYNDDDQIGAIVMTGAGERAFSAGQDLGEAHDFDGERAVVWVKEWQRYYAAIRNLQKPLV